MEDIDKTKENIRIHQLDSKTKKDLFDRFVNAGGEVVGPKRNKNLVIDRDKQKSYQEKLDSHSRKVKKQQPEQAAPAKSANVVKNAIPRQPKAGSFAVFIERIRIRLHLKFMRVAHFNGYYFNIKFLSQFCHVYKPSFMEIQLLYLDIFRRSPKRGAAIIVRMDKAKPLYYELIEKTGSIYDKLFFDRIIEHYQSFPDVPKKLSDLKEQMIELYRKLYILKPYEDSIYTSFEKAMSLHAKSGVKKYSQSSHRRKLKNDLFIIFHKVFPRLHWLFCHYQGKVYDVTDPAIEEILSIVPAEKPGSRRAHAPSDTPKPPLPDRETKETSEPQEEIPEHIKKGLELIYQLNISDLRKEFDKNRVFENHSDTDRMLMTYLFFNEFDREYSFILTTSKIKFNIDFTNRENTQFRDRLSDLYNEMRRCSEILREYTDTILTHDKIRQEKPSSNSQYIGYTRRIEASEKQVREISHKARMTVNVTMGNISAALKILVEDMNSDQKYIINPQEILTFDTHIEGEKKLNGKKIYEAIETVYCYTSAFARRLEVDGDLSSGQAGEKPEAATPVETDNQSEDTGGSVLSELDDLI